MGRINAAIDDRIVLFHNAYEKQQQQVDISSCVACQ